MFVQYKDIVAEYSNTVAAYMAHGYTIFTPTMAGSQGEEAHVHLINPAHTMVVAVLLEKDSSWSAGSDHKMVIRCVAQGPAELRCESLEQLWAMPSTWVTFWNNQGTELHKRVWYAMEQGNGHREYKYTEDKTVPEQAKARREYKWRNDLYVRTREGEPTDVQIGIDKVVKFVRKHGGRGYGNTKAEEIKGVRKYDRDGIVRYIIDFNGAKKQLAF